MKAFFWLEHFAMHSHRLSFGLEHLHNRLQLPLNLHKHPHSARKKGRRQSRWRRIEQSQKNQSALPCVMRGARTCSRRSVVSCCALANRCSSPDLGRTSSTSSTSSCKARTARLKRLNIWRPARGTAGDAHHRASRWAGASALSGSRLVPAAATAQHPSAAACQD